MTRMTQPPRDHAEDHAEDHAQDHSTDRSTGRTPDRNAAHSTDRSAERSTGRTPDRPTANPLAAFAGRWIRRALAAAQRADAARLMDRLGSCGHGVRFGGSIRISAPEHAHIGHNVHIGDGAFFRAEGGLTIGDNAHISRNLVIYTINHQYEGERLPYDEAQIPRPVVIGKNVWIGMNVCIVPGTRIGWRSSAIPRGGGSAPAGKHTMANSKRPACTAGAMGGRS